LLCSLQSDTKIKINFSNSNLSSDISLLLFHEFVDKLGLNQLLKNSFKTTDKVNRQISMMKFYCKKRKSFVQIPFG